MNAKTPLDDFRADIAGWLAEWYPAVLRPLDVGNGIQPDVVAPVTIGSAEQRWHRLRAECGWLAPTWPREYGGAGLDKDQARVLAQELRRVGVRPPPIGGMTDEGEIGFFMKRARAVETTMGDGVYHRDRFATLNSF